MAKKKVIMLTSMGGRDYSYQVGQVVSVEVDVATAWVDAGIAKIADKKKIDDANSQEQGQTLQRLQDENVNLRKRVVDLLAQVETLETEKQQLSKKVDVGDAQLNLIDGEAGKDDGGAPETDDGGTDKTGE